MQYSNNLSVVFCAHISTNKENIGDVLSAQALKILSQGSKIYCLPRDTGLSRNKDIIYGGGGMIRSLFHEKINEDFKLRDTNNFHYIYGVGLNVDKYAPDFSKNDILDLKNWLLSARSVTVRDLMTRDFIESFCNKKFSVAPCPTYQVIKKMNFEQHPKKYQLGIVVGFEHTKTYIKCKRHLLKMINSIIKEYEPLNLNINIICHDEQDYNIARDNLKYRNLRVSCPKSFKAIVKEYSCCRGIITARGHGVVFAAAVNLPCSIIPLNIKLISLYEYHYGKKIVKTDFEYKKHLKILKKNILPKKLNYKFKL